MTLEQLKELKYCNIVMWNTANDQVIEEGIGYYKFSMAFVSRAWTTYLNANQPIYISSLMTPTRPYIFNQVSQSRILVYYDKNLSFQDFMTEVQKFRADNNLLSLKAARIHTNNLMSLSILNFDDGFDARAFDEAKSSSSSSSSSLLGKRKNIIAPNEQQPITSDPDIDFKTFLQNWKEASKKLIKYQYESFILEKYSKDVFNNNNKETKTQYKQIMNTISAQKRIINDLLQKKTKNLEITNQNNIISNIKQGSFKTLINIVKPLFINPNGNFSDLVQLTIIPQNRQRLHIEGNLMDDFVFIEIDINRLRGNEITQTTDWQFVVKEINRFLRANKLTRINRSWNVDLHEFTIDERPKASLMFDGSNLTFFFYNPTIRSVLKETILENIMPLEILDYIADIADTINLRTAEIEPPQCDNEDIEDINIIEIHSESDDNMSD